MTVSETISLKQFAPEGLLLSVYFDFDSDELTPETMRLLDRLAAEMEDYSFHHLHCDGFADEFGPDNYNVELSGRRAQNVVRYLREKGANIPFDIQACGKTLLPPQIVNEEIKLFSWPEGFIDWVQVNRRARRVDIYNKK